MAAVRDLTGSCPYTACLPPSTPTATIPRPHHASCPSSPGTEVDADPTGDEGVVDLTGDGPQAPPLLQLLRESRARCCVPPPLSRAPLAPFPTPTHTH